jgi:hypothetical protein
MVDKSRWAACYSSDSSRLVRYTVHVVQPWLWVCPYPLVQPVIPPPSPASMANNAIERNGPHRHDCYLFIVLLDIYYTAAFYFKAAHYLQFRICNLIRVAFPLDRTATQIDKKIGLLQYRKSKQRFCLASIQKSNS